ncbi:MAG: hypothetical protein JST82_15285 [Bacteroidetes bacterium]|nr:hypothetical protein [Bacteroidota bacterium]
MIRNIIAAIALSISTITSYSQTRAVTDKGEEVILYADGTWKSASITPAYETRLDTIAVLKDKQASFLTKSNKVDFGIWINPKKWSFKPYGDAGLAVEYLYTLKGEDCYGMLITERVEVTNQKVSDIVLSATKKIDPDAHIIREETRNVNGNICSYVELAAKNKGMSFVYIGYMISNPNGTVRVQAFTTSNLLSKYKTEMETFINGFVSVKQ